MTLIRLCFSVISHLCSKRCVKLLAHAHQLPFMLQMTAAIAALLALSAANESTQDTGLSICYSTRREAFFPKPQVGLLLIPFSRSFHSTMRPCDSGSQLSKRNKRQADALARCVTLAVVSVSPAASIACNQFKVFVLAIMSLRRAVNFLHFSHKLITQGYSACWLRIRRKLLVF